MVAAQSPFLLDYVHRTNRYCAMITLDVDNVVQVLDEVNPFSWRNECEAKKLMLDNPYKQMNAILVHHDAMLWHSFHNDETWDIELERDEYGVIVTEFLCHINQDSHIGYTVLSYYGAHCDFMPHDAWL